MSETDRYESQRRQLDPVKLLAEAQATAGLSDYGDKRFVEPLTRFMDRAAREVDFSADGLQAFKADVNRFLVNRLRTHADIQRHPEILEEDVSDPLIIIGLPRSGTTKMQRMLASAPNVQKLFMWRMLNPAPFPNAVPGQRDPRMAAAGMDSLMATGNDAVKAAHAMAAGLVDEEFVLFDFTLDPSVNGYSAYIPLFFHSDWVTGKDREADREAYRYMRTLLQYLQWQDGGKRGRPWILKCVIHVAHMDALLECFPRATLVHCHRDPRDAIPSVAKFQWELWNTKAKIDKKFSGQSFLQWASTGMKRYLEARKRLRLDSRILDAKYENIRDDVMPIIRKAYKRAGWELSGEAEQAMLEWEKNNEQGKHGKHSYSLEEFGLSEEMADQAFAEYIGRFISR